MNAQIKKVTISTCLNQNSDICAIERNSSPEISIEFNYVSAVIARKANVTVNAFLDSAIIAPPVLYDACAHRVACPILQGSENVFKAPMPVKTQHVPPYEVAFSYKMRDGNGPMILCMKFVVFQELNLITNYCELLRLSL